MSDNFVQVARAQFDVWAAARTRARSSLQGPNEQLLAALAKDPDRLTATEIAITQQARERCCAPGRRDAGHAKE